MTREEKEQTGKYVLQMARLLEDGCYQQEMLLKAVHIIDEALEQEPESSGLMTIDEFVKRKVNRTLDNIRADINKLTVYYTTKDKGINLISQNAVNRIFDKYKRK